MIFIQSIFEGMLAAAGSLILELVIQISTFDISIILNDAAQITLLSLIATAIIEEVLKYLFVLKRFTKLENKDEIIRFSLAIGAGFFLAEFLLKFQAHESTPVFAFSGVLAVHLLTCFIAGYFLKKNPADVKLASLKILALNSSLHLAYNFFIISLS